MVIFQKPVQLRLPKLLRCIVKSGKSNKKNYICTMKRCFSKKKSVLQWRSSCCLFYCLLSSVWCEHFFFWMRKSYPVRRRQTFSRWETGGSSYSNLGLNTQKQYYGLQGVLYREPDNNLHHLWFFDVQQIVCLGVFVFRLHQKSSHSSLVLSSCAHRNRKPWLLHRLDRWA